MCAGSIPAQSTHHSHHPPTHARPICTYGFHAHMHTRAPTQGNYTVLVESSFTQAGAYGIGISAVYPFTSPTPLTANTVTDGRIDTVGEVAEYTVACAVGDAFLVRIVTSISGRVAVDIDVVLPNGTVVAPGGTDSAQVVVSGVPDAGVIVVRIRTYGMSPG
jgi:hypothetical protein